METYLATVLPTAIFALATIALLAWEIVKRDRRLAELEDQLARYVEKALELPPAEPEFEEPTLPTLPPAVTAFISQVDGDEARDEFAEFAHGFFQQNPEAAPEDVLRLMTETG